jgi:hypothetical protein
MIEKFFDAVFGCAHQHYGFPMTIRAGKRRNPAASLTGTYVVCLDCGKEMAYDWNEMKIIKSQSERRHYLHAPATHAPATKQAA